MLFPVLARSGIWDPYELDAGDLARRIALRVFGAHNLDLPGGVNVLPTLTDLRMGELPFTSMAIGFKLFGLHDWTGRLPLAVWGFAGVAVLYETMARLVDRRAGLYGVIALVTMPLYFMQARTMLGDIVTMSALTIAFCGLLRAMLDARARWVWLAVGGVGLVAGYLSRGLLIGVAVPALAVGLSWAVLCGGGMAEDNELDRGQRRARSGALRGPRGARLRRPRAAPGDAGRAARARRRLPHPAPAGLRRDLRSGGASARACPLPVERVHPVRARPPPPRPRRGAARGARPGDRRCASRSSSVRGWRTAPTRSSPRGRAPSPSRHPPCLRRRPALAILDFERGAPHSRALALGSLLLGVVIFADIYREPEKALAAFVVDRPQFPKTFEGTGQTLMGVVLVLFVGLSTLVWFESQSSAARAGAAARPGSRRVATGRMVQLGTLYRRGRAELGRTWNGNLVFGMVVIEAALVDLGGDDLHRPARGLDPRRQAAEELRRRRRQHVVGPPAGPRRGARS